MEESHGPGKEAPEHEPSHPAPELEVFWLNLTVPLVALSSFFMISSFNPRLQVLQVLRQPL
jgi:hypothetical protein